MCHVHVPISGSPDPLNLLLAIVALSSYLRRKCHTGLLRGVAVGVVRGLIIMYAYINPIRWTFSLRGASCTTSCLEGTIPLARALREKSTSESMALVLRVRPLFALCSSYKAVSRLLRVDSMLAMWTRLTFCGLFRGKPRPAISLLLGLSAAWPRAICSHDISPELVCAYPGLASACLRSRATSKPRR